MPNWNLKWRKINILKLFTAHFIFENYTSPNLATTGRRPDFKQCPAVNMNFSDMIVPPHSKRMLKFFCRYPNAALNQNIKSMKYRKFWIMNTCFGKIPSREIHHVPLIVHQRYVELEVPNRCGMLFSWTTIKNVSIDTKIGINWVTLSYLFVCAQCCWQPLEVEQRYSENL